MYGDFIGFRDLGLGQNSLKRLKEGSVGEDSRPS